MEYEEIQDKLSEVWLDAKCLYLFDSHHTSREILKIINEGLLYHLALIEDLSK